MLRTVVLYTSTHRHFLLEINPLAAFTFSYASALFQLKAFSIQKTDTLTFVLVKADSPNQMFNKLSADVGVWWEQRGKLVTHVSVSSWLHLCHLISCCNNRLSASISPNNSFSSSNSNPFHLWGRHLSVSHKLKQHALKCPQLRADLWKKKKTCHYKYKVGFN